METKGPAFFVQERPGYKAKSGSDSSISSNNKMTVEEQDVVIEIIRRCFE